MNDRFDHKSGDGVPCQYPSRHSSDFVRSVAQGESRGVCAINDQATNEGCTNHDTPQQTSPPTPEPHPALSHAGGSACASKGANESTYGEDTEQITEKIIDPASGEVTTFEAALQARYERLSLLTLDLATEAGESVRELSYGERRKEPKRLDRGITSMTKAIWAHRVIEKLRTGESVRTEDLTGLLTDFLFKACHHPSTHSPNDIRGMAQNEVRGVGRNGFSTQVYRNTLPNLNTPFQRPRTRHFVSAQEKELGSGATDEMSIDSAIYPETPASHSKPLSKNAEQTEFGEDTETKKEKTEIEKTANAPHRRELEIKTQSIHPTGEMCALNTTTPSESIQTGATHTDKMIRPGIKARTPLHQELRVNQVRPPP